MKADIQELKSRSNIMYVDTSKNLGAISVDTEYTASQDCIVLGMIATYCSGSSRASVSVLIDGVNVGAIGNSGSNYWDSNSIYYPLKEGQKFKLQSPGISSTAYYSATYLSYTVNVFGTK